MWYIWYSTSTLIFILSLIFGFLLMLLFVYLCNSDTKKVINNNNQIGSIENPRIESIQTSVVKSVSESIETNNKLKKQILNKKMDLSNINSKYLNNQENKVIYSNYLTKSSRSFLGY
jgi:hypothetical protein